ncbi:MAG TPA: class I SAM-dependent methyltransferase [Pirellulales bacterium]|nr:class I SAM-dependent methyltransferase [Pirellulales bacterium]
MAETPYNDAFFAFHEERSRASARETIPLVLSYVQPKRVVDVGCGIGTWLVEFKAAGISDVTGIDGDYVNRAKLLISASEFRPHDLTRPFALDERFDLASSLEVAEHLPPESADAFVDSLTRLAPVILFSAAIPHQSGDGHVNEQFPEYWQAKFLAHDFVVVDCLRRPLWNNPQVAFYYRQNILFFVQRDRLGDYPRLAEEFMRAGEHPPLAFVHPETYRMELAGRSQKIRQLQSANMRYAVRLRSVNLVVFPDWAQPAPAIVAELAPLLQALSTHPERRRITLVVYAGRQEGVAAQTLTPLIDQILPSLGRNPNDNPIIAGIGPQFGPDQWELLMESMQCRVALVHEDQAAIVLAKAQNCPAVSIATIQNQPSPAST